MADGPGDLRHRLDQRGDRRVDRAHGQWRVRGVVEDEKQASVCVVRGGQEARVEVRTIVRGDIVVLGPGDVVPADCRLIQAADIKVSEMALTGEPDDVAKTCSPQPRREGEAANLSPENMVFSGCSVTSGKGRAIVVCTGMRTRIGRIAQLTSGESRGAAKKGCYACFTDNSASVTQMQQNLEALGVRIGLLAIGFSVLLFVVGVAMDRRNPSNPDGASWLYMLALAVTVAVAAIPECIPLCVKLSLSTACKDMLTKNVLVRKLAAVETLGSVSVICVGLVAAIDSDRDGVKESVGVARDAGIRVVMITGDYLKTAIAIAKNVQILQEGDDEAVAAVDCADLRPGEEYLPNSEVDALTASVRVFARARPEDKMEIVKSLQRQGLVTAMTGDGVNDAPALNQADIGVAMGIQGTEVAKGASDMILTDDNFCSIVAAVEKGRAIYAGIQKFVAFIMSVHIAEVLQIFVCIVAGVPVMRTPLQILFLILVTDLPPSIALGMEPGESTILKDRPRPKDEPVVLGWMWVSMILNGVVLSGVIVAVYIASLMFYCQGNVLQADIDTLEVADRDAGLMNARTVAFISLVWSENVRSYTSRSFDRPVWRNIFGNRQMQKAIFLAQACLYVAVLVPFISDEILGLSGVTIRWEGWLIALAGPVGCLVLCELCKLITAVQMRQYQEKLARAAVAEAAPPAKAKGEDATKVSAPEPGFDFNSQNVIIEV
uniref:Cation-transporting P-type ATPase C-terminal domain-containing protein n=1 Tax=Zooxanthella nutricula TaxID=1333877 RepID=A0A7S2Q8R1_9DINO|mmetsp:Transcript_81085/g.247768  ORF Transcript_81085/g.247768 Transcript_81085/m.247768 type:complete len:718 (+) Transcript_81085:260-2413(+)